MDQPAAAQGQAKKRKTRKRKTAVSSPHDDGPSKGRKKVRRPGLTSWTVAQLRSACRKEGLATQGTKRDLVERYAKRMEAVQDSVFADTHPRLASDVRAEQRRESSAPRVKPQRRQSRSPSARRLRQEDAARQGISPSSNRRRRSSSASAAATRSLDSPTFGRVACNRPSPIKLPDSAASVPATVAAPHSSDPSSVSCSDTEASSAEESVLGKSLSAPLSAAKAALDASATAATLAVTEPLQAIAKSLQSRGILPTQQNFDDAWQRISRLRNDLAARLTTGFGDGEESVAGVDGDVLTLSERLARSRDELMERIRESMADSFSFFSWAYMSRLLAAICLFFLTGYINAVCASCAGYRTPYVRLFRIVNSTTSGPGLQMIPEGNGSYVIPDIGLDAVAWLGKAFLPENWIKEGGVDWLEGPDLFVTVHGFLLLGFLFISPQRLKIVRRLFVIYSFLNLLRAFTVIATSLPDPTPKCRMQFHNLTGDGAYKMKPMFPAVLWRGFKVMNMAPTCGDCVFSGHSTLMLLVMKTFTEYVSLCNSAALRASVQCCYGQLHCGTDFSISFVCHLLPMHPIRFCSVPQVFPQLQTAWTGVSHGWIHCARVHASLYECWSTRCAFDEVSLHTGHRHCRIFEPAHLGFLSHVYANAGAARQCH